MKVDIRNLEPTRIIGMCLNMSLTANRTVELWKNMMPHRHKILPLQQDELFSIQVYQSVSDITNSDASFLKWAGVRVAATSLIPEPLKEFTIEAGDYAVFYYSGGPQSAADFFKWVFTEWLPKSQYQINHRPHFEILPSDYMAKGGQVEEQVWIPIKVK